MYRWGVYVKAANKVLNVNMFITNKLQILNTEKKIPRVSANALRHVRGLYILKDVYNIVAQLCYTYMG